MGLLTAFRRPATGGAPPPPRRPSAQTAFVTLDSIEEGVVCLDGGHYRAVLEVGGVNFGLRGETEQEAVVAAYAAFLNGLTFPIQVLVRAMPIDVDVYLKELEQRARYDLPDQLAALARDHVLFLRRLARNRSLLERRFYVVVPAETGGSAGAPAAGGDARSARSGGAGRLGWWPFSARPGAPSSGATAAAAAARRQLTFRCEEVQRQLARCGLAVRRLESTELAQLYYACWCPELARIQRLRGQLDDYTSLVLRSADGGRAAVTGVAGATAAERRMS